MPNREPSGQILDLEREILRAFCGRALPDSLWKKFADDLAGYRWLEPEHAIVFQALLRIRSRDPKGWRDQLAAQATRMGFPDVDWEMYFSDESVLPSEIENMIRKLIGEPGARP
ncbi:MAG TPA: hypothetical protein VJO53_10980 [Candidatus Acidoferrales bacterium]|nr:hypothetical protein [Candidatus Acidoferrales bacterium]